MPLILRKLAELDNYLGQISGYSGVSIEKYRKDWKVQRIVERTLQMMIETCVDIANHVISDSNLRPPSSYADAFVVLKENGIISEKLSINLQKMAKFRNVVVHQYEQVDASVVVLILTRHIQDFERFKKAVLKAIKGIS